LLAGLLRPIDAPGGEQAKKTTTVTGPRLVIRCSQNKLLP